MTNFQGLKLTKFFSQLKKTDDSSKEKYESIKTNLLKQIKQSEKTQEQGDDKKEELNFVNRTNRLTNSLIKSLIKNNDGTNKVDSKSSALLGIKNLKTISKKAKDKIKKQVWHESM